MNRWRNVGGGYAGQPDWNYFRNVGTVNGCGERWYCAGGTSTYVIDDQIPDDTLFAIPFLEVRGGTLDRIGVYLNTNGGNLRCGIYNSTSMTNLYPSSLVLDTGGAAGAFFLNSWNIAQALSANTLYWLVYLSDIDRNMRTLTPQSTFPMLGANNTFLPITHLEAALAYGALPANFPAGATWQIDDFPMPAIGVRYSA